ncbi:DHH family phosphoesterase [Thermodesulfatator autotrophicus]|uniref:Phosphoethanolamine methyltransferase n=1 Tax=Thermodesulfatator autotrophicus TaxID=1795632 RepID=A0A177EA97_9BACT|nr:DHH family phosphoesterase [Thermodesulfatator autotrophicus]OAG28122.1 phosphoethanolamine methyltransferase [Thermodesulfatator autotrophicus]
MPNMPACKLATKEQEVIEPRITRFKSNRERVKTLLSQFKKEDRVLILIWADPDSMASALAMKRLIRQRVSEVTIAHVNEIRRLNNLAMAQLLKIPLVKLRQVKASEYNKKVLIDSQPPHNAEFMKFNFDVVIDHHPISNGWDAPFIDIRPEYGAVSSMMTEYLRTLKVKPAVTLATALIYGIKTDTNNFEKECTIQDVLCFQYLFKRMNRHLLHKIEASTIRRAELKYFRKALEEVKVRKQRLFSHLGKVPNPDILVVIADFLNHVHEIGWVFVSGEYRDRLVVIIRCDGYRKDAGKLAQRVFGKIGFAGGHREKARAEVPLENINNNGNFTTRSLIRILEKHFRK